MPRITVIAHNIRSSHNVGAIFRTAEGFGVSQLILSGYTPYPSIDNDQRLPHIRDKLTAQIHKTALGAEQNVAFSYYQNLDKWIDENKHKLPIIALEQAPESIAIADFEPPDEFALLIGEEVAGIAKQYLDQADAIVEIPMFGKKESFNVSVATGIALYALSK